MANVPIKVERAFTLFEDIIKDSNGYAVDRDLALKMRSLCKVIPGGYLYVEKWTDFSSHYICDHIGVIRVEEHRNLKKPNIVWERQNGDPKFIPVQNKKRLK